MIRFSFAARRLFPPRGVNLVQRSRNGTAGAARRSEIGPAASGGSQAYPAAAPTAMRVGGRESPGLVGFRAASAALVLRLPHGHAPCSSRGAAGRPPQGKTDEKRKAADKDRARVDRPDLPGVLGHRDVHRVLSLLPAHDHGAALTPVTVRTTSREWLMSQDGLDRLLAALDADRDRAGRKYQDLRLRVERFFWCRGAADYEDLVDETFDRVMRRMAEGEEIRASDPALYFYGVARNVLRERWAAEAGPRRARPLTPPRDLLNDPNQLDADAQVAERRLACLDRCLETLPPETRSLLLRYYQDAKAAKSQTRQELAREQGIALNALRIRLHRIRQRLEPCLRRCSGAGGPEEPR